MGLFGKVQGRNTNQIDLGKIFYVLKIDLS